MPNCWRVTRALGGIVSPGLRTELLPASNTMQGICCRRKAIAVAAPAGPPPTITTGKLTCVFIVRVFLVVCFLLAAPLLALLLPGRALSFLLTQVATGPVLPATLVYR